MRAWEPWTEVETTWLFCRAGLFPWGRCWPRVATSSKGSGRNQDFYTESPNFACFQLKKKFKHPEPCCTWRAKRYREQPRMLRSRLGIRAQSPGVMPWEGLSAQFGSHTCFFRGAKPSLWSGVHSLPMGPFLHCLLYVPVSVIQLWTHRTLNSAPLLGFSLSGFAGGLSVNLSSPA